jgi:hypothetical protein
MTELSLRNSNGKLKIFTKWMLLECDDNIGAMYRALYALDYFYKPRIQKPLWGSHISVIRGETVLDEQTKSKWQDKYIEYSYLPEIQTNGVHFWLPVICPILSGIRKQFGLGVTPVPYHLTIGNICDGSGYTPVENF